MPSRSAYSEIIDGLLRFAVAGGVLSVALVAPNSIKMLDKPLRKYLKKLDNNERQREIQKALRYMKSNGLVKGDYQHGVVATEKARRRLAKIDIDQLSIATPKKWDKKWRIVLYDIPEKYKPGRDALTSKLRFLKFYQLQKSVWIYPYKCREEIEDITAAYGIGKYVTYIETSHIEKQEVLEKIFKV